MTPHFFSSAGKRLFGIHYPPRETSAVSTAALLFNPFGQEAVQAHRILRVLAQRLSAAGLHALRFDYFATGDSEGDSAEGAVDQWLVDAVSADNQLRRLSNANRVVWIGLRFGATLAAMASRNLREPLDRLVLWDPVVSGASYVEELWATHVEYMRGDLPHWAGSPPFDEAVGYPLGKRLVAELQGVELTVGVPWGAKRAEVILTSPGATANHLRPAVDAWTLPVSWTEIETPRTWNSDAAMNACYVPIPVISAIVESVRE